MLDQIKDILILSASGIGLIGIPILITLLFKVYDTRIKLLEIQTAKMIWEQKSALEHLHSFQIEQLNQKIQEIEQENAKLSIKPRNSKVSLNFNNPQFDLVRKIHSQSRNLAFDIGSEPGRTAYEQTLSFLPNPNQLPGVPSLMLLFTEYEESITKQQNMLNSKK